jgi:hypothetical protein
MEDKLGMFWTSLALIYEDDLAKGKIDAESIAGAGEQMCEQMLL